ncbi:MAG: hypothetical protein WBV73_14260, partial [Phormidium sp.]
ANNPDYQRLNFCLIGVITPSDLISDPKRTPFNIGHAIELNGFTLKEASRGLKKALGGNVDNPDEVLEKIIDWTNGQPLLTQKLCKLVIDKRDKFPDIEKLVNIYIIDNWKGNDDRGYLKTIEGRILHNDKYKERRLMLYKKIWQEETGIAADNTPEQEQLCLSGVVRKNGDKLIVCNKICRYIFNLDWIEKQINNLRPYPEEYAIEWADTKNESLLLSGQALEDALAWKRRMGDGLSKLDADFLNAIKDEITEASFTMRQRLWGKTSTSSGKSIADEILKWTNQDLNLTKIICNEITSENVISEGTEKQWFQEWIETNIINNWKNSILASYFKNIKETFLVSDLKRSFGRLNIYKEILQGQITEAIDENDLNALLVSGLIVRPENQELRVANRIYETVFNQQWIDNKLPPYAKSFIAWSKAQDEYFLLKGQDLDTALNWLKGKERLNELEIKFIIASLVWGMWQSATNLNNNARSKAVEIITLFQTQLKEKNNNFYNFIQQALKNTAVQPDLLKDLLSSFSQSEKDIFIEYEAEIEKRVQLIQEQRRERNEQLLNTWTVAYEKAMVEKFNKLSKKIIDQAFCEAVEDLTKRLVNAGYITSEDAVDRSQKTMEDSIRHHIENLTKGGMFNLAQKLTINELINSEGNIVEITVEDCTYQEGCKWALDEPLFREKGQYRCQKLGCYVGAVKKYMAEDKLSEDKKNKLDYLMTTVMESIEEADIKCRCKGFIFVNEGFKRQSLLRNSPTQLPTKP